MKYLRHLLGITKLDKEKNQCIRQKTGVQKIVKEIKQYQKKWLRHVQRMDTNRLPKQALQYKPKGRRNIGRSRKRWRDQLHLEDQGTGNTPNPSGTWWWEHKLLCYWLIPAPIADVTRYLYLCWSTEKWKYKMVAYLHTGVFIFLSILASLSVNIGSQ